jgi:hypothetical protein
MASEYSSQPSHLRPGPGAYAWESTPAIAGASGAGGKPRAATLTKGAAVAAAALGFVALGAAYLRLEAPGASPEVVVRQFVEAKLSDHDNVAAARLGCRNPQLEALDEWQADLAGREALYDLGSLHADVSTYSDTTTGNQTKATVEITVAHVVGGRPAERITRPYDIVLIREHGWKVCRSTGRG